MPADWQPSQEYQDYCREMRRSTVSDAYRCDKCGEFHQHDVTCIQWAIDGTWVSPVDLCPACAAPLVAELGRIAAETTDPESYGGTDE